MTARQLFQFSIKKDSASQTDKYCYTPCATYRNTRSRQPWRKLGPSPGAPVAATALSEARGVAAAPLQSQSVPSTTCVLATTSGSTCRSVTHGAYRELQEHRSRGETACRCCFPGTAPSDFCSTCLVLGVINYPMCCWSPHAIMMQYLGQNS